MKSFVKIFKQKPRFYIVGFLAGILNGFFGAGGGIMVVPMLSSLKLPVKKAHATSIAIIAPLSAITAAMYLFSGIRPQLNTLLWVIPTGLIGAAVGAFFLKKISPAILSRIFGGIMIISAIRLLLR